MKELIIHPVRLQLKKAFKISYGTYYHRDGIIVALKEGNYVGYGEATAISYYGKSQKKFIEILTKFKPFIEQLDWDEPTQFWTQLAQKMGQYPFLLCALDVAAHDLWAKKQEKPLYKAWNLSLDNLPLTNYTISIDSVENMLNQMKAYPNPIYKIKLDKNFDLEKIKVLRQYSDAIFRVDANGAWSASETINYAKQLRELEVEFIEQPLPASDNEAMEQVFRESALPVIADESCQTEHDVAKCHNRFHGINIKLMKCGGYTPALRMIQEAKARNMKVMCGCMTESSIGISAIAQLLPLLDYVDMDGALLLKNDPAIGVKIENGKVIFPEANGIGAKLI